MKVNFDGFCCNLLLSGLGSVWFFFLLSHCSLQQESETYEQIRKLLLKSLMFATQECVQLFSSES